MKKQQQKEGEVDIRVHVVTTGMINKGTSLQKIQNKMHQTADKRQV